MIEFTEPRPPVSAEHLAAAEKLLAELGHCIPPSYKAFLARHDGGEPQKDCFSFHCNDRVQMDRVQEFLGIAPVPSPHANLVRTAAILGGRVPAGVLPIAPDEVGNLSCLDGRDGRVLFWDHEYDGDPPDEANLHLIARDLLTFLDGLVEDLDPPRPRPRSRWRRLLRR